MCANIRGNDIEEEMRDYIDERKELLANLREKRRLQQLDQKRQQLLDSGKIKLMNDDEEVDENDEDFVLQNPQQQLARRIYEDPNKQRKYNQRYELGRGKTQEELLDYYARGGLNTKEREFYGDPKAVFANDNQAGSWKVKPLDAETLTKLKANENNAWTNVFDKPKDFSFNAKMLDPQYAAWTGVRRGTNVYHGKFNDDEFEDVIEVDDDGYIRTYNGYTVHPSKQGLYNAYYKEVPAVGKNGKPYYATTFRDWEAEKRKEHARKSKEDRALANKVLHANKMKGFKAKEQSINEQIKDYVKDEGIYNRMIEYVSQQEGVPLNLLKKSLTSTVFISQIVRAFISVYFNKLLVGVKEQDDIIFPKLMRICNSKKSVPYLKEEIITELKQLFSSDSIGQVGRIIYKTIVLEKNYMNCLNVLSQGIKVKEELKAKCLQAHNNAHKTSTQRKQNIIANRQGKRNPMLDYQLN